MGGQEMGWEDGRWDRRGNAGWEPWRLDWRIEEGNAGWVAGGAMEEDGRMGGGMG